MRNNTFGHRLPTPHDLAMVLMLVAATLPAQETIEPQSDKDREARLKLAEEHADLLEVRLASGGDAVARVAKPLLVFGDSARNNGDGTLWAWGRDGRPLAMAETFRNTTTGGPWVSALTLTSTSRIVMKTTGPQKWQPGKLQITPTPLPDAPAVDEREAARLRTLKHQSRRFTAHEFWDPDNSRFELRLLVQPVHRYQDKNSQIWDGAIFVLAHGTNPEVLVFIEAIGESLEKSQWHYSLARLGSAELHVEIDAREVWKQDRTPGVVGRPTDPYWLSISAAPVVPAPKE